MVYSKYEDPVLGYKSPVITRILRGEGMSNYNEGVAKFLKRYQETGKGQFYA